MALFFSGMAVAGTIGGLVWLHLHGRLKVVEGKVESLTSKIGIK
jgi:uncharacterized membrane protein YciS (DUF1049 family)